MLNVSLRFLCLLFFLFSNLVPVYAAQVFGVKKVISGDTLELFDGRVIRLIGLKADSSEAKTFVRSLVEGRGVTLEYDKQKKDKDGHELVYALMVETFVNATILYAGYGVPQSMPPNTKYDAFFQKLYQDARANKRGLWKK